MKSQQAGNINTWHRKCIFTTTMVIVLLLLHSFFILPQPEDNKIYGTVINEKGEVIPFADVALLDNAKKVIFLGQSDPSGRFIIENAPEGTYKIVLSRLGCQTKEYDITVNSSGTELGELILEEGIALQEATITAEKSHISSKVDRLVYSVEDDPEARTSNILHILKKIPYVNVDIASEKIEVFGEEGGFVILVDGKENVMLSASNQYVSKTLKANRIKEIELITSPDGKYFQNTAVLNIVTKSSLPDGIMAQISTGFNTDLSVTPGIDFTSKINKLIYNLQYSYGYSDQYGSKTQTGIKYDNNTAYDRLEQTSRNDPQPSETHQGGIKASYDFNENNLLYADFNFSTNNHSGILTTDEHLYNNDIPVKDIQSSTSTGINQISYAGKINYQYTSPDKKSVITTSYLIDNKKDRVQYDQQLEDVTTGSLDQSLTRNLLINAEQTGGLDYSYRIDDKQSIYLTAKYIDRHYKSNVWSGIENGLVISDALEYRQHVSSVAGNYSIRTRQLMITANLSYEHTRNRIDYYLVNTPTYDRNNSLLGTLRLTYRPGRKSTFIVTFNNSSFRPDITYLNPYEDKSIPNHITTGNPHLKNATRYQGMLLYRYALTSKFNFQALISGVYSDNSVQQYSYTNPDGILVTTYGNIGKQRIVFFSGGLSYAPSASFQMDLSGRMARYVYEYPGNSNAYWEPNIMLSAYGKIWKGGFLGTQIIYTAPNFGMERNIQARKQTLRPDAWISLTQEIGQNLRLRISTRNFWSRYIHDYTEDRSTTFYRSENKQMIGRTFSFSITYTFGRFRESIKNTGRGISNSDRTAGTD